MSLYIATLAEAKADLGIGDTADDAVLTRWLEALQGRLETHCGRVFLEEASRREIHDGGVSELLVAAWPIESVSEILIDGDQDWTDPSDTLTTDDYLVEHKRGRIIYGRGSARWPALRQGIRVTYTGGLLDANGAAANSHCAAADVQALKRAFLMQGEFEWRNRQTLGLAQISATGMTVQAGAQVALALKGQTFLPEVETTLAPLRRIV